jgi:glycosyltransferase involved in cell wall biosynthesis
VAAEFDTPSVVHVVRSTQRRGAEVFGCDLSAELGRLGLTSRVVALTPGSGGGSGPGHQLDVPALGARPMGPSTLRALRREAGRADVVVAHGSRTLDACAVALAGTGTPFVYRSIGDPAAWSAQGIRRVRTALLLRRAARVAVLWPGAADTLRTAHGVPAAKAAVIPNGVAVERHPVPGDQDRVAARARLGLPAEAPVAACIGALSAEKRVVAVIDAVSGLPGVHLLLAGEGPERAALEAQAAAAAGGRVRFAGVLPGPHDALAAADVVVLASRTEGMPGVLIEAGLAARPCVATAVGGVGAVVDDGVTGVLVPPGDDTALARALGDLLAAGPARLAEMGAAARARCAERFAMSTVASAWADLLAAVARRRARPSRQAGPAPQGRQGNHTR